VRGGDHADQIKADAAQEDSIVARRGGFQVALLPLTLEPRVDVDVLRGLRLCEEAGQDQGYRAHPIIMTQAAGKILAREWDRAALAIDFLDRNRMRLNGRLAPRPGGFRIHATEVYSNCPKYIQARSIDGERPATPTMPRASADLSVEQRDLIQKSDTFFIATVP